MRTQHTLVRTDQITLRIGCLDLEGNGAAASVGHVEIGVVSRRVPWPGKTNRDRKSHAEQETIHKIVQQYIENSAKRPG